MRTFAILTVLSVLATGVAHAGERSITLTVDKMYCDTCPLTVRAAIQKVKGVKSATVSYQKKTAVVVFDDTATTPEAIAAASTKIGYPARLAAN